MPAQACIRDAENGMGAMSSVLGVSVGAGAVRLARPLSDTLADPIGTESFDLQTVPVGDQQLDQLTAETVGVTLGASSRITGTAVAYRGEQRADALRASMARQQVTEYQLVPETDAAVAYAEASGALRGVSSVMVYDMGSSGLSVSLVDIPRRTVQHSNRTSDISGDYLDSLIREQQIASGRVVYPHDSAGLAELDTLCRSAKEQLSSRTAVALPCEYGLVLLAREGLESLIVRAVENSARMARDVLLHADRPAQAVLAVGGGAQIPLVTRILWERFGVPVVVPDSPESAVARGAALLARPMRPAGHDSGAQHGPGGTDTSPAWLTAAARRQDRREVSGAVLTVSALAVIAALGLGLGYGPQVLEPDSGGHEQTTPMITTPELHPADEDPRMAGIPETTTAEREAVAEPPPRTETPEPPPDTPAPNTFVVPGLPPIVVPTIPPDVLPQFPPPVPPPG